jgi:hypothetical protein
MPEGYVLTHNRDENPQRGSSKKISHFKTKKRQLYYPQDLKAHGTWVGISAATHGHAKNCRSACLLNGGTTPYAQKKEYPVSRGNIVPAVLKAFNFKTWAQDFDFSAYEPFTLIVKEAAGLFKLVHNQENTFWKSLNAQIPHIWCSTTLYNSAQLQLRAVHWKKWLTSTVVRQAKAVADFHLHGLKQDNLPGFQILQRPKVKTVSISQISLERDAYSLHYQNIISQSSHKVEHISS